MSTSYLDLTPAEIDFLKRIASLGVYTVTEQQAFLNSVSGALKNTFPTAVATVSSGSISIPRLQSIFFVEVDTEGQVSSDELNNIEPSSGSQFFPGDIIILTGKIASRVTVVKNNIRILNIGTDFNVAAPFGIIGLCYRGNVGGVSQWTGLFRSKDGSILDNVYLTVDQTRTIDASGVIDSAAPIIPIQSERVGENLASSSVRVLTTGTDATFTFYIDTGSGPFFLVESIFVGSPSVLTVINQITADVNAGTGTHGYTSSNNGVSNVNIVAPAGTGASANSYLLTYTLTGGATVSASGAFSGGLDGVDANDTLITINGLVNNQMVWLRNIMPNNIITCTNADTFLEADTLPAGSLTPFIYMSGKLFKFSCCRKQLTATRFVDLTGNSLNLKSITWPYPTISGAVAASNPNDNVHVLASGNGAFYDERNLLALAYLNYKFDSGANIFYSGAGVGGIFDDSATGGNGPLDVNNLTFDTPNNYGSPSIGNFSIQNNGSDAGGDVGVFKVTDVTQIYIKGGRFTGKDYVVYQTDGTVEFSDSFIAGGANGSAVYISGGVLRFRNCFIYSGFTEVVEVAGGKVIFENCLIQCAWANAAGYGIRYSGGAGTGNVVFSGSTRIVVDALAKSIYLTAAQNCKIIGKLYANSAIGGGGVLTDMITGAAAVVNVDVDVE